jgi:hypothetical protein
MPAEGAPRGLPDNKIFNTIGGLLGRFKR